MSESKKSFVLYGDMQGIVQKLPTEKAGELFLLILKYVNGEQVEINDLLLEIAFEPIKSQLDRDAKKWQGVREARSEAGKKGGRPKKQDEAKKPIALLDKQTKAKKAVTVNDTVTVTVNGTENDTVNSLNTLVDLAEPKQTQPLCPYKEIVDAYNRTLGHALPQCKVKTPARLAAMKRIWIFLDRDMFKIQSFFDKVNESDFLTGRGKSGNAFCGFDWLMKQNNCTKTIEGNYDNA